MVLYLNLQAECLNNNLHISPRFIAMPTELCLVGSWLTLGLILI